MLMHSEKGFDFTKPQDWQRLMVCNDPRLLTVKSVEGLGLRFNSLGGRATMKR